MLKLLATDSQTGRKMLGIGLSHRNLERLKQGLPIHFNAEEMGIGRIQVSEVVIFAGKTEESMRAEFEAKGLLDRARIIEEPVKQ